MSSIYELLENGRKAYRAMADAEVIAAMEGHMHLDVDPVQDGIVDEDGRLSDRDAAVRELCRAD